VSTFPASTHSPQTGLAKIKPEPRLNRGDVLTNLIHAVRSLSGWRANVNPALAHGKQWIGHKTLVGCGR
jgi:hypothetical protein